MVIELEDWRRFVGGGELEAPEELVIAVKRIGDPRGPKPSTEAVLTPADVLALKQGAR